MHIQCVFRASWKHIKWSAKKFSLKRTSWKHDKWSARSSPCRERAGNMSSEMQEVRLAGNELETCARSSPCRERARNMSREVQEVLLAGNELETCQLKCKKVSLQGTSWKHVKWSARSSPCREQLMSGRKTFTSKCNYTVNNAHCTGYVKAVACPLRRMCECSGMHTAQDAWRQWHAHCTGCVKAVACALHRMREGIGMHT